MNRMELLYDTTKQMVEELQKEYSDVDTRTEIISNINTLLEKRDAMLEKLTPPYTEEEEAIGKKIIEMDVIIKEKMDHIYKAVQDDLKHLKNKKDSNKAYLNPYKGMKTVDGMYLDNKL